MDLVNAIAGQLGVDQAKAGGVLGTLLGTVQDQLGSQSGPEAASSFGASIPELGGLLEQAKSLTGGGAGGGLGGFGGLASGLLGNAGGGSLGVVAQVASKLAGSGLDLSNLSSIVPLVLPFLAQRLPPELLSTVTSMLGGAKSDGAPPAAGGGLGGLVGGLFG